jgi:hypothetical protein
VATLLTLHSGASTSFFGQCFDAAKSVITNMVDNLAPSGYMRYAPDGHFVFASFASAFLLKLLRPEFSHLMMKQQENEVFELIGRLIQTLSSPEIAIDDRHTPRLYARFLAGLLLKYRRDGTAGVQAQPQHPPSNSLGINVDYLGQSQPAGSAHPPSFSAAPPPSQPSPPQPGMQRGGGAATAYESQQSVFKAKPEPIYRPEASSVLGTGTLDFTAGDTGTGNAASVAEDSPFELDMDLRGLDEEMLATMQTLKNPSFWENMMMPGCVLSTISAVHPGF